MADQSYNRADQDLGNIVEIGHVNVNITDQRLATHFYITGLGLTRDPFLNTGVRILWVNVGTSQFHLPTGQPNVLRGTVGLVVPNRDELLARLAGVRKDLEGTKFSFREANDCVETVCPWGNRIHCYAPDAQRFGRIVLGMPFVEFDVRPGAADGIVRFYREIMDAPAEIVDDGKSRAARVQAGRNQHLCFRETDAPEQPYDGHHVQIHICNFSRPYDRLRARGLITREFSEHEYRFQDIVDPDSNEILFTVEHEVRSQTHPMFARPLVNRNPNLDNRDYRPGQETISWSM